MKVLKILAIVVVILGAIGIAMNMLFAKSAIGYLEYHKTTWVEYYTYDFKNYFLNLNMIITKYYDLALNIPEARFTDFLNGLITIVNYVIMIVNIIMYPLRIGAYIGRILLCLIGINIVDPAQEIQWIVDFVNTGVSLNIPYIEYLE